MISRASAAAIAEAFNKLYCFYHTSGHSRYHAVDTDSLYDWLFEHMYPAWLCNAGQNLSDARRAVKEWIMRFHTGESLTSEAKYKYWTRERREQLGQELLKQLAEDLFAWSETADSYRTTEAATAIEQARRLLELDGYIYADGILKVPEADVLDVAEECGVLESLHKKLSLDDAETTFHHLKLSEDHYVEQRWDDSISNSRKFLECILREVASKYANKQQVSLGSDALSRPVRIRDFLEQHGLLETKEKDALAKVYGLLSETGSHPYMAENDQARLLRHLALTFSQFVMLRPQGAL